MKALIWIACIVGASIVQVLLKYMGIGGAIPAMLVYGGMYASARTLCQKYDKRKAQKATEKAAYTNHNVAHTTHVEEISIPATNASHPPIVFCRKCGNKLIDGSEFCSFCGAAVIKE